MSAVWKYGLVVRSVRKETQVVRSAVKRARVRSLYFFFQAEDGIRDYKVTGVQTCALPISLTNPGGAVVRVRITAFGASGGRTLSTFDVPAQTEVYRDVPATDRGAATEVE